MKPEEMRYCSTGEVHLDFHGSTYVGLKYLLDHFGGRLNLRGCISTAGPLAYGTPEDVRRNCTEILDMMKPYGGYHFAPTHAIQDNSPVENVYTMYQTIYDYYRYAQTEGDL